MSDVKYSKEHEWIKLDGDIATIGITKHATEMLGDIVFAELPAKGSIVDDPSKINADPEGEAWFFKLKIKDVKELDSLMNKEDYDKFAKESGQ